LFQWNKVYDFFEKSGNYEYLPEKIFKFYAHQSLEKCKKRLIEWEGLCFQNSFVSEFETIDNQSLAYDPFTPIFNDDFSVDVRLKNSATYYLFLCEAICNVLNISDRLFIPYVILNRYSHEI